MSSDCTIPNVFPLIGVGLRHEHYNEALSTPANIDFVEVHAENFFAEGGATYQVFNDIYHKYPLSLHATSLGLGSVTQSPFKQIEQLNSLIKRCDPVLVSDHACFSWAEINEQPVHGGDLLPIPFNDESLKVMASNVLRVQNILGRTLLVENLSAYIELPGSTYTESEFLTKLCELTECKLLIDLNNLTVNATNFALLQQTGKAIDVVEYAKQWLDNIHTGIVGEFHLAGCRKVPADKIMIDDHSQPVSDDTWAIYKYALSRFGAIPTLVEWDENLPSWQELLDEANKAKLIAQQVFEKQYSVSKNEKSDDMKLESHQHA